MRAIGRAAVLALALGGCATLPDVDPWLRYGGVSVTDPTRIPRPLTTAQTEAILAKVVRKGDESDLLARQTALEEAVAGTPLVPGNDVTLLQDGPATYQAMFEAIARATDHVNLEFYTIDEDGSVSCAAVGQPGERIGRREANRCWKRDALRSGRYRCTTCRSSSAR